MFYKFRENMLYAVALGKNKNSDGTANWNLVDSDMYEKWSVLLNGETYDTWFNCVADELEGVTVNA
jgi:hypothetical protein